MYPVFCTRTVISKKKNMVHLHVCFRNLIRTPSSYFICYFLLFSLLNLLCNLGKKASCGLEFMAILDTAVFVAWTAIFTKLCVKYLRKKTGKKPKNCKVKKMLMFSVYKTLRQCGWLLSFFCSMFFQIFTLTDIYRLSCDICVNW